MGNLIESFINRAGRYDKYCGKILDHKSDIHILLKGCMALPFGIIALINLEIASLLMKWQGSK